MSKDLFSIKSPLGLLITVLVTVAVFFLGQFIVGFFAAVFFLVTGKDQADIDVIFAADRYWPQVIVLLLTSVVILWLMFRALHYWRLVESDSRAKKTQKLGSQNQKAGLQKDLKFLMLNKRPSLGWLVEIFATYGFYIFALIVVSFVLSLLGVLGESAPTQDFGINPPEGGSSILAVFVMFVVIPPIIEEVLFRGFLYNTLLKYGGIGVAYVLTSILFGLAHLEFERLNWVAALDTLIFSGFLIYIAQKHQSLYSAMILHAMKNGLAFYLFVR